MADVEIDQDTLDWMRSLYHEARSKNKAIPILAQCTCLTHAQVRAVLGLPEPAAKRSAKKDRALALLARGYPQHRVAIMVGVTPETLGIWAKQAREEGSHEVRHELCGLHPPGQEVLRRQLPHPLHLPGLCAD